MSYSFLYGLNGRPECWCSSGCGGGAQRFKVAYGISAADARRDRVNSLLNQISHFTCADKVLAFGGEITSAVPFSKHFTDCRLNNCCLCFELERMPQQHGRRKHGAQWIGDSLARDVGRRAVNGLVQSDFPADTRRRQESE